MQLKSYDNYFYNIRVSIISDIEASNMEFLIDCAKIGLSITSVLLSSFVKEVIPVELPLFYVNKYY